MACIHQSSRVISFCISNQVAQFFKIFWLGPVGFIIEIIIKHFSVLTINHTDHFIGRALYVIKIIDRAGSSKQFITQFIPAYQFYRVSIALFFLCNVSPPARVLAEDVVSVRKRYFLL